jgi:predicted O-methyltransferase YrrM
VADRVLEVGGGYSTLWLAQRCQKVLAIEENSGWGKEIRAQAHNLSLDNIEMLSGDSRSVFSEKWKEGDWDVVVIDGPRERLNIFYDILASQKRPRVIVYDDTDKVENRPALHEIIFGYKRKTYRGFKPQTVHVCETTVFYRE